MKKYQSIRGFTLVELIVVITILAILATIGFVSYTGFTSKARDSSRLAQMKAINNALEGYTTKGKLPLPDDRVTIYASGVTNIVGYQGNAGDSVLNKIGIKEGGKDPSDDKYYTYYVDSKLRNTELLAFLENDPNEDKETTYIPSIEKASATDYTSRIPRPYGSKLGILLDTSNNPIQENTTLRTTGLDIVTTTTQYTAVFSTKTSTNSGTITGTGGVLAQTNPTSSCKRILETGGARGDGVYTINPAGTSFSVYCDMTTDGGGWTLLEGYKDTYADEFKQKPFNIDYPVNESTPSVFDRYRLGYSKMLNIFSVSSKAHARCHKDSNQSLNDYVYLDKGIFTDTAAGVDVSKWNAIGKVAGVSLPKSGLVFRGGLNGTWHRSMDGVSSLGAGGSSMEYFTRHDNNRGGTTHKCWDVNNGGIYLWFLR